MVTIRKALTPVQSLAGTYIFKQLDMARQSYIASENMAKAQYTQLLKDAGIPESLLEVASFESNETGAFIEYPEPEKATEPVFEKPPLETA